MIINKRLLRKTMDSLEKRISFKSAFKWVKVILKLSTFQKLIIIHDFKLKDNDHVIDSHSDCC